MHQYVVESFRFNEENAREEIITAYATKIAAVNITRMTYKLPIKSAFLKKHIFNLMKLHDAKDDKL